MNFRGQGTGRGRTEVTLELTPLIDVIFLLLIFFVMTTSPGMSAAERLDLDLPDAASGEAAETTDERVVVRIFSDGEIRIQQGEDGEEQVVDDLDAEMARLYEEQPEAAVWIRGDVDASHGAVIQLLDVARNVGFQRVHMAVRPGG